MSESHLEIMIYVLDVETNATGTFRFIILHAGNENGFIPGAELIFASKSQSGDYHGEMNQENFLKWFQEQLMPSLTQPSAIVLDNAPYHNQLIKKIPNSSWNKASIQEWLRSENVNFNPDAFKNELLGLVKR